MPVFAEANPNFRNGIERKPVINPSLAFVILAVYSVSFRPLGIPVFYHGLLSLSLLHHGLDLLLQLRKVLHFGIPQLGKKLPHFRIADIHHMLILHGLHHLFVLEGIIQHIDSIHHSGPTPSLHNSLLRHRL